MVLTHAVYRFCEEIDDPTYKEKVAVWLCKKLTKYQQLNVLYQAINTLAA